MNKTKLLAVAAGFLAAGGIATAGKLVIDGVDKGTYEDVQINGNGSVFIKTSSTSTSCPTGEVFDSTINACREQCSSTETYNYSTDQCEADDTSGTGGDGGDTNTPANCESVGTVGGGWTQDTSKTVFSTFPLASGNWEKFTIPRNEYQAIKFTTNSSDKGKVSFDRHTHAEDTTKTIAITECPGDFSNTLPSSLCRRTSQATAIYFNTESPFSSWECPLEPNRDYYLNIAYGKGTANNLENTCTETKCGAIYAFYH